MMPTNQAPSYQLISQLFIKGLSLIYFAAFFSLYGQIDGLVGPQGILPFTELLQHAKERDGMAAFFAFPVLFWISAETWALESVCLLGMGAAVLLLFDIRPRLMLLVLFVAYLSLYHAGQTFLNFQWDYLLLETGLLALFLGRSPHALILFLLHFLLFKLRFLSGLSKVLSADPAWESFSSLQYYFYTQPLPHIGAWYAQQLPEWLLTAATAIVLFSELVVPFFIFLSRKFRLIAVSITLSIQFFIILTSNHNFINLLTILLCLFLLDDKIVRRFVPQKWTEKTARPQKRSAALILISVWMLGASLLNSMDMIWQNSVPPAWAKVMQISRSFSVGNVYHVFPTMQTQRQELVIEGSHDGKHWQAYDFKYKPDKPSQLPGFIVPHQPRLDWMMWFIPPQYPGMRQWFERLMWQLFNNQPSVTALLAHNPFVEQPPKYMRVLVYDYRFSTAEEYALSKEWWVAQYLGEFPHVKPRAP